MSKKRTTAGELIAMLSELDPETHVFVDIGNYDWDYSQAIRLTPIKDNTSHGGGKKGAVHLSGLDDYQVSE